MTDENPYQSPQSVDAPPGRRPLTPEEARQLRYGLLAGVGFGSLMSFQAPVVLAVACIGFICCFAVGLYFVVSLRGKPLDGDD